MKRKSLAPIPIYGANDIIIIYDEYSNDVPVIVLCVVDGVPMVDLDVASLYFNIGDHLMYKAFIPTHINGNEMKYGSLDTVLQSISYSILDDSMKNAVQLYIDVAFIWKLLELGSRLSRHHFQFCVASRTRQPLLSNH